MMGSFIAESLDIWFAQFAVPPHPAATIALVAAFAAHNLEEVCYFQILAAAVPWPLPVSRSVFVVATVLLASVVALLGFAGNIPETPYGGLLFLAAMMLGLNAAGHIGGMVVTGGYVPGAMTATLLVLPASLIVVSQMVLDNGLPAATVVLSLIVGVVMIGPVIIASLGLATVILAVVNIWKIW